jgi:Na+/H+ antiporter NhaD/arsenite permease-like protein
MKIRRHADAPRMRPLTSRAVGAAAGAGAAALAGPAGALPQAGDGSLPSLGGTLSLLWGLPFAGLLLSIALMPLLAPRLWHRRHGTIAAAWALALFVPFLLTHGVAEALHRLAHAVLLEYVPFVAILFALFTIAGGICFRGTLTGTPAANTALLALGALLANFMGTTGASMLLVRPLLTALEARRHKVHAIVFFIIIVGNVGGALSPLGDPPLFIGFLKGVEFFWTTRALAVPTLSLVAALLAVFFAFDWALCRHEGHCPRGRPQGPGVVLEGATNFLLLGGVIGAVLMSASWNSGVTVTVAGVALELQDLVRDGALVILGVASLALTPADVREHNRFHWAPMVEVAKLFAAIFLTIFPVLAILEAGRAGALAGVLGLVSDDAGNPRDAMIFWITGALSACLDNAPTYLVFFNLVGGDAQQLMGARPQTLAALSMGAVYFGALTYIGNAPNFMIKAIAEDRGVSMPGFFAYTGYAAIILLPPLALLAALQLSPMP